MKDESATPSPAPGLDQFDRLFDQVIAPALAPYEAERGQVVGRFWRFVMTGGVGGLLLAAGMAVISRDIDLEGSTLRIDYLDHSETEPFERLIGADGAG